MFRFDATHLHAASTLCTALVKAIRLTLLVCIIGLFVVQATHAQRLSQPTQGLNDLKADLDSTLSTLKTSVEEVKTSVLDVKGTVDRVEAEVTGMIVRITITEMIMSILATLLTVFFTAYFTARKIAIKKVRDEINNLISNISTMAEGSKPSLEKMTALGEENQQILALLKSIAEQKQ